MLYTTWYFSEKIIAQLQLFAIFYTSFCLSMQWLAAKNPEFGDWGRGWISNSKAINTFCKNMMEIADEPTKVPIKGFMMNNFHKYVDTLPPFKEYWKNLFKMKWMEVGVSDSGAKVLQLPRWGRSYFIWVTSQMLLPMSVCSICKSICPRNSWQAAWWEEGNLEVFVCIRISSFLSGMPIRG
jgi:hypothetical protein